MYNELKLTKENYVKCLFFIVLLIFLTVQTIRFIHYSAVPIGYETYYHQRMAQEILESKFSFNPFHILIAFLSLMFGIFNTSIILPMIIGLLNIWLLIKFLNHFELNMHEIFYSILFFILSPIFIFTSSSLNVYSFSLLLALLGFKFTLNHKVLLTKLMFILIALSSLYSGILVSIALFFEYLKKKEKAQLNFVVIIFIISLMSMQVISSIDNQDGMITSLIGDLGGMSGLNIYTILLSFIGIVLMWKNKIRFTFMYLFIVISLIISIYFDYGINLFLMIPLSIFATHGLIYLKNRNWKLDLIKDLIILVLVAGYLTSTIGYIDIVSNADPNYGVYNSLATLRIYAEEKGKVLSTYDKSEWIKSIARVPVLNDLENKNLELTEEIFLSKNFNGVINLLKEHEITYIWIDTDLKNRYWPNYDNGLVYFMQNKENFEQIYAVESVELWKFIGETE